MIKLQTSVKLPTPLASLGYGAQVMSLGSCFSEHIGLELRKLGYTIEVNPYGILYNPLSIHNALERMLEERPYTVEELTAFGGLWHSMEHHGRFSTASPVETLKLINQSYERGCKALRACEYLLLTWGTAFVYQQGEERRVVANCHKLPEHHFTRGLMTIETLLAPWQRLVDRLLKLRPDLRIITTISPIRHLRDGAHGNNLSKATLHLFDETLRRRFPEQMNYFPSYEIVLDELRDYRFYADDLTHPSTLTQKIITERLVEWLCSSESRAMHPHLMRLRSQYLHRPLHTDNLEYELQREQLQMIIRSFALQHPEIELGEWFDPK